MARKQCGGEEGGGTPNGPGFGAQGQPQKALSCRDIESQSLWKILRHPWPLLQEMGTYDHAGKWKKETETLHGVIHTQPRLYGKNTTHPQGEGNPPGSKSQGCLWVE